MPCLSHISSLECLRQPSLYALMRNATARDFHNSPAATKRNYGNGEFAVPDCVTAPYHFLVPSGKFQRANSFAVYHARRHDPSPGMIKRIDQTLLCTSPEFCFIQMANMTTIQELIALGCELCSYYSIQHEGYLESPNRTTHLKLASFVRNNSSEHGIKAARRALGYIIGGARSPSETALALLASLPLSLGGYALPKPFLNRKIKLGDRARMAARKNYYRCDLLWPRANLALEYDSDAEHTGKERIASDSIRRNILQAEKGITVITVTNRQLRDPSLFDELMRQVAKLMHVRLRPKNGSAIEATLKLRKILFRHERRDKV